MQMLLVHDDIVRTTNSKRNNEGRLKIPLLLLCGSLHRTGLLCRGMSDGIISVDVAEQVSFSSDLDKLLSP